MHQCSPLRKRFLKEATGPATSFAAWTNNQETRDFENQNNILKTENDRLRKQLEESESSSKSSKETTKLLEDKIAMVEASAFKSYEEKHHEVTTLKNLQKNLHSEIAKVKKDLNLGNKSLKVKENEIFKLNQKCDNLASNVFKYKTEIGVLQAENKKLIKQKSVKSKKSCSISTNTLPDPGNLSNFPCGCGSLVSSSTSSSISTLSKNCSSPTTSTIGNTNPTKENSSPGPTSSSNLSYSSEATTSKGSSILGCPHPSQCVLRHPDPPPPFAPLTFDQFYNPPKPPPHIRLLPDQRLTYSQYCELSVSHKCEECDEGGLYHNYTERVEYDDPGPCRGVIGTYPLACPNHPKAVIRLKEVSESENKWWMKLKIQCDLCSKTFSKESNMNFHKKRNHMLKIN